MMQRIDHNKMYDDLFIEMLDVFFNSILYLRDVYPSEIFRRRRIYSTAIYASIYPPLNDYLKKVLKTAFELKSQQKLYKVELVIFKEEFTIFDDDVDEEILEKFVFQIEQNDNNKWQNKQDLGDYLMEYEEQVRQALHQINYVMKNMKPLDGSECGFRIELETTQDAFVDLVNRNNSQPEDFSWIKVNDNNELEEESPNTWRFLPILKTNYFNMHFQTLRQ